MSKDRLLDITPIDQQVTLTGIIIHHIADGKILESWVHRDAISTIQQSKLASEMA